MNREKLARLKKQSREDAAVNVIQRGSVHFRLDPEMMSLLIDEANKVRVPFGVFARMLMIEGLVSRSSISKSKIVKRITLPERRSTGEIKSRNLA